MYQNSSSFSSFPHSNIPLNGTHPHPLTNPSGKNYPPSVPTTVPSGSTAPISTVDFEEPPPNYQEANRIIPIYNL
eukprot:jgi/Orpsp1_1/1178414/evm.model.c7180000065179.1